MNVRKSARSPVPTYHPDDVLLDAEAAAVLRIKPGTLRVWRSTRRSPQPMFVRFHRTIRYVYPDLQAFLAANTEGDVKAE
jgi:hypothetical protein